MLFCVRIHCEEVFGCLGTVTSGVIAGRVTSQQDIHQVESHISPKLWLFVAYGRWNATQFYMDYVRIMSEAVIRISSWTKHYNPLQIRGTGIFT